MSKKDLDEAIFRTPRPSKIGYKAGPPQFVSEDVPLAEQGDTLCFDIKGDWTANQQQCAAKVVTFPRTNTKKYFVKWCTAGPDKGHLLNPYSIYYQEGDDKRMESRRGQLRYEFKVVSENAFSNYIRFLKTHTFVYCQEAERGILNA